MSKEEVILSGLAISEGIAIGTPFFFADDLPPAAEEPRGDIDKEVLRYRRALYHSRQDIQQLQQLFDQAGSREVVAILDSHLEMLKDPVMTDGIEEQIRTSGKNLESIFHVMITEYKRKISSFNDQFFEERVRDVIDVSRRVLGHLQPVQKSRLEELPSNAIVIAADLAPSQTAEAGHSKVSGFVTMGGGYASHAAIIARAKRIPYVAHINIHNIRKADMLIDQIIVDGTRGCVILNPTPETLSKFQQSRSQEEIICHSAFPAETIDGLPVKLLGNINSIDDLQAFQELQIEGVGLFRTEYVYLDRPTFPTEEEQFVIYRALLEKMPSKPQVFRVFDIGADKIHEDLLSSWPFFQETNPVLGCRAIRFLLRNPSLFEAQLRALLRASVFGDLHLLVPMVSDVSELREVKRLIEKVRQELQAEGHAVSPHIPLGCMIEVPAGAVMSDVLAAESDFLSIGTNDLSQYVLAADRSNQHMAQFCNAAHPSLLRLLRLIVAAAQLHHKRLILCGEAAADHKLLPILLGLGLREFSLTPRHIPLLREKIRSIRFVEACRLAEEALQLASGEDLQQFLNKI